MHARRKAHIDTSAAEAEVQRAPLYETVRQFRIRKEHQTLIPVVPNQRRASSAYGQVPNDLERLAYAAAENEVLDLVNQVLEILHRSGRIDELPQQLRMERLTNLEELRIALTNLGGGGLSTEYLQRESDSLCVVRAVLAAAEERLRQLRRE